MVAHKTGQDIDSQCNRCKLFLAHVVVAMDGGRVVRVQCKTCHSTHAYRGAAVARGKAKPRAAAAAKTASGKATMPTASDYDRLMQGTDVSRARRYRISETFAAGDVVDHKTFGLGLVLRLLDESKFEAVFPTGAKTLAHGRQ